MHLCCTKVCYVITNPPLTPKTCPVMNGASTKNAIACAISSGVPSRSIGVCSRKRFQNLRRDVRAHVRLNDARADRVHADVARTQLLRQRFRQRQHRALCRRIRRLARRTNLSPHGRHRHNRTRLLSQHPRQRRAHAVENSVHVHRENPPPLVWRNVRNQPVVRNACVADQRVERRKLRKCRLHLRLNCHIAADCCRAGFPGESARACSWRFS